MEWVYKLNEMVSRLSACWRVRRRPDRPHSVPRCYSSMQDFKGQLLAERLYQIIIAVVSVSRARCWFPVHSRRRLPDIAIQHTVYRGHVLQVVGFIHGYVEQSFKVTFTYWLIASLVAALLTVPGWTVLYHRHPVKWLDKLPAASAATSNSASSSGPGVPTPAQPAANKQATKKQQ